MKAFLLLIIAAFALAALIDYIGGSGDIEYRDGEWRGVGESSGYWFIGSVALWIITYYTL